MKTRKNTIILYLILALIFFLAFLFQLGSYPLLDPDETRYVDMSKNMFQSHDFMTLYLNGEYFFEKPPLFFWIECLSFKILGFINEYSARLPLVLLSLLPAILLFNLSKKIKGIRFAFLTTLTLMTSFEYIIITKLAILDTVLVSLVSSSVLCYFYTFFCKEKNKKYFWILSYVLCALSILAKGIPGLIIPFGTIFFATILFKSYKETLKNLPLGLILVAIITLPWHIIMLKTYPHLFFNEYIYKHHILRFLGSEVIHRNEPVYFYLLTLLWGLIPYSIIILARFISKIKNKEFNLNCFKNIKEIPNFDNYKKFIILNIIATLFIFIFFSSSKTKLITYIAPIYPFTSVLIGAYLVDFIKKGDKIVKNFINCFSILLIIASLILISSKIILNSEIYSLFYPLNILGFLILFPFGIIIFKLSKMNKRFKTIIALGFFSALISGMASPYIYKFDYKLGQNDLMIFAKIAKEKKYTISTYLTGQKYSLLFYGNQKKINFQCVNNVTWLKNELKKKNHIVIIKNKFIKNLPVKIKQKGVRFSIIKTK